MSTVKPRIKRDSFKEEAITAVKKLNIEGLSEKKIKEILSAVKRLITHKISKCEEFNIVGIASIRIGTLKERKKMNIFGRKTINLPKRNVVRIKVSEVLKKAVRE